MATAFRQFVVAVAVFVIFAGGAFAAYQVADTGQKAAGRTLETEVNETVTQQVGNWILVDQATAEFNAGFNNSTTVYNTTDVELTRGTDYEWNNTDGAVKFLDTAKTADGENANITYEYYENNDAVKRLSGPLGVITTSLGQLGLFAGGLGLLVILLSIAAYLGRTFTDQGPRTNR